jgi:MATE family multidrug resistance protein
LFRRLLRFGVPNGVFVALETGAFTGLTLVIGMLGDRETAASTLALTLNMIAFLPAMGIGQTVEVLVGKYQGEDRPDLSAQRTYVGFALSWTLMAAMAVAYFLIPNLLLIPFHSDENAEITALAAVLLRFVAFYCLFDAGNSIFSSALRGAGDTRFVMRVVSFLPWLGMVLPCWLAYWLGYRNIYVMWTIASAYIAVLAFVFYARFRHGAWRTMKVIEATVGDQD